MRKPIAEVLAIVHNSAMTKVDPPWNELPPAVQALQLSAMTEVVRALELLNLFVVEDGDALRVVRHNPKAVAEGKPSPTEMGHSNVQQAQAMGFTGIPCSICGSPNTTRVGTCLQCHNPGCMHSGECG